MVLLPISLRKQKWYSQWPQPSTTSLCPFTLPLGPILSDLLKDVTTASIPFLLQYHQVFLFYWINLIIIKQVVIFPLEKSPSWLHWIPFISFSRQQNLRTVCSHHLQPLFSHSPWNPHQSRLQHHSTKTAQITKDSAWLSSIRQCVDLIWWLSQRFFSLCEPARSTAHWAPKEWMEFWLDGIQCVGYEQTHGHKYVL